MEKQEIEFLKESNAIEREYSEEALEDSMKAWKFAEKLTVPMDVDLILKIHKRIMRRLNKRIAGKIRQVPVYIGGKRKDNNRSEIDLELINLCKWEAKNWGAIKKWHIRFEDIHPFEDGNGRTGRILMNIQRLNVGLPLLIIHEGEEQFEYYKWFKEKQ